MMAIECPGDAVGRVLGLSVAREDGPAFTANQEFGGAGLQEQRPSFTLKL
jgi:hypothetical protein